MEPMLRIENLCKSFPGVKALDNMSFDLYPGEVHILAGENGAGKSTLSKCILGYVRPDGGHMFLDGKEIAFASPKDSLACGIAAVYQELTMVPWLNAAENIFFNREPVYGKTGIVRTGKMISDARTILSDLGSHDIDVTVPVRKLGIAKQQMVEIARALSMDPRLIIFDEPTSALSEKDTEALFAKIHDLKKKGAGIIYISHRMKEYDRIGDRITVMRDGKYICTGRVSDFSGEELIHHMVGRKTVRIYSRREERAASRTESDQHRKTEGPAPAEIKEVLKVENLCDKKGRVKNCSLSLRSGEIAGIAGLVGSGRTELARLLFGIDKAGSGKVLLYGEDITGCSPGKLVRKGIGLLPEDRKEQGLALRASLAWNVTSAGLHKAFPGHILDRRTEKKLSEDYMEDLNIAARDTEVRVLNMSGGNQQKLVLAKWLLADTDVIIFDEPTRGIDVQAKREIYAHMAQLAASGKAILLISSELSELIGMCDRIYVMREGAISGELSGEELSEEKIGEMMFGVGV